MELITMGKLVAETVAVPVVDDVVAGGTSVSPPMARFFLTNSMFVLADVDADEGVELLPEIDAFLFSKNGDPSFAASEALTLGCNLFC